MSGFVPGRDRVTIEAMTPEQTQRAHAVEASEERAELDRHELAELERHQSGAPVRERKRSLLDRLLGRR